MPLCPASWRGACWALMLLGLRGGRDEYAMEELLGGRRGKFSIDQRKFRRDDLVLVSAQGLGLGPPGGWVPFTLPAM